MTNCRVVVDVVENEKPIERRVRESERILKLERGIKVTIRREREREEEEEEEEEEQ
jgi:hypothetical protein